ncbi:hypothetical protein OG21DRAFT_779566 [Imleria badia]|nr:hypothetical protein OG21DRAFT_779566 [Imleria badia]
MSGRPLEVSGPYFNIPVSAASRTRLAADTRKFETIDVKLYVDDKQLAGHETPHRVPIQHYLAVRMMNNISTLQPKGRHKIQKHDNITRQYKFTRSFKIPITRWDSMQTPSSIARISEISTPCHTVHSESEPECRCCCRWRIFVRRTRVYAYQRVTALGDPSRRVNKRDHTPWLACLNSRFFTFSRPIPHTHRIPRTGTHASHAMHHTSVHTGLGTTARMPTRSAKRARRRGPSRSGSSIVRAAHSAARVDSTVKKIGKSKRIRTVPCHVRPSTRNENAHGYSFGSSSAISSNGLRASS